MERRRRRSRRIQDAWLRSLSAVHPPDLRKPPRIKPEDG
jgi:hypothetical protein